MMARMLVFVIVLAANPFASAQESTFGSVGETTPVPPPPIPALATIPSTKLTTITYSVADLVVPLQGLDYPWSAAHDNEHTKTKEAWLMQKITTIVAPKSWKDSEGSGTIQYFPFGMAVVVKQTPEVQVQVADLLATMRRVQNVEVAVDMRLVNITDEYFGKLRRRFHSLSEGMPLFLTKNQISGLLEEAQLDRNIKVLQVPRLTMCSGQHCKLEIQNVLKANVEAMVAADLRYIRLDLKAELPDSGVSFAKTLNLPDGGTAVLLARGNDGAPFLFMATPRVIICLDSMPAAPIMPPSRALAPTMPKELVQASATEVVAPPTGGPSQKVREKQVAFKVSVLEGDPLGSREANTVRTLVDTSVATLENQAFRIQAGGQFPIPWDKRSMLPFGTIIEATPTNVEDSKLRLDLTVSLAKRGEQMEDRVQIQTESTRTIMTMTVGELVRLRLGKKADDVQRWVEITATEVTNAGQ